MKVVGVAMKFFKLKYRLPIQGTHVMLQLFLCCPNSKQIIESDWKYHSFPTKIIRLMEWNNKTMSAI